MKTDSCEKASDRSGFYKADVRLKILVIQPSRRVNRSVKHTHKHTWGYTPVTTLLEKPQKNMSCRHRGETCPQPCVSVSLWTWIPEGKKKKMNSMSCCNAVTALNFSNCIVSQSSGLSHSQGWNIIFNTGFKSDVCWAAGTSVSSKDVSHWGAKDWTCMKNYFL